MKKSFINGVISREWTDNGPVMDRLKSRIGSLYSRNWLVIAPMLIVVFGLFGVNEAAWAWATSGSAVKEDGGVYYVLYETTEHNFSTIDKKEYTISGPGAQLYYEAKCVPIKVVFEYWGGDLKVGQYVNNKWSAALFSETPPKNSYKSYGPVNVDVNATKIKLYTETGATGKKYMKNVKVTMAQYLNNPSTTSLNCGTADYLANNTNNSFTIAWCNVPAMTYELTGDDADLFTVSISNNAEAGKWNVATITVTCNHSNRSGGHSATLTMKDSYGNYSKTITLSATTNKGTPSVDCSQVTASALTYGKKLSESTISGPNASYKNGSYAGTYTWKRSDASTHVAQGCTNYVVKFTPTNTNLNSVECTIQVPITKVAQTITWSPSKTYLVDEDIQLSASTSGDASVYFESANTDVATIDGNWLRMVGPGNVVIKARANATCNYLAAEDVEYTFQFRHRPTVVFTKLDHIYSGNTLSNMAKVQYNGVDVPLSEVDFDYSFDNPSWFSLNPSNDKQIMVSTEYGTEQNAKLYVTTEETDYYTSVTADTTYHLEVKRTPEFYLNGLLLDKNVTTNLNLEVDETATFTFDKITSSFQFPTTPSHFTYNNATGVLTATVAGDEPFFFNEPGDSITFQHQCNLHLYVSKHETELKALVNNNAVWMVDDTVAESSIYELVNGDTNVPVVVSSSNTNVIAKENGKWVAKGKGSAVLTIAQVNSDKWTGDTITRTINVHRYDPVFDWSGLPDTLNFNTTFVNPVRSTSDGAITYKSNKSAVTVTNDSTTLHTAETADNAVIITAIQKPTYKYEGKTATKTVKVLKLRNHVQVEVKSNETYLAVRNKTEGDVSWVGGSDNAIRLGGSETGAFSSPAWNWNDKYIDVKFEGIPKTVSFTTGVTSGAATAKVVKPGSGNNNGFWYMIEYPEGESEKTIWTDAENNNPGDISRDLKPNTNKVRICYTGNFAGYVKNLTITERTELTASTNDIAFGEFRVGDAATERSFTIDWYNLNPLTVTSNNPKFVVLTQTIASKKDSFATNVPIRIQYLHTEEGTNDSGTITVTNNIDGKSVSVTVHGKTLKRTQTLSWLEDYDNESPVMNVADTLKLAKATSGLPVTYLSSDTTKAVVINDTLVYAKGLGEVTITAKQSGNGSWGAAEDISQTFRVTQKIRQILVWSQDLTRLNPDNEVKRDTLTARVMVLNQESGELEEVPEQTAKIQYTITGQAGVVSLSDSIITYTETEGSTAIRAYVPEDETYAAVSLTKQVRVRRPANGCDDPLLPTNLQTPYEIFTGTLDETHVDITLDRTQGEPESMIFYHRGEYWWLLNKWSFYEGELQVQQYVNDQWSDVLYSVTPTVGESHESARIPLDRRATMIRITRPQNGQGYHYIDSIAVFRKKYIESATTAVNYGTVDRGDEHSTDITVNYSNCKSDLFVTHKNAQIALKRNNSALTSVGIECGEINSFTFRMTFTPDVPGEMKDTIVIADTVGGLQLAIPVSANIKKSSQSITWTQDTAIVTTTNLTLAASATSGESVTYSVVSGSDVATVNENTGVVTIIKNGTVTFRATQTGTDYYNFITKDRTFTIEKVTPTITKAPKASDVTLPAMLSASTWTENGVASVDGTFAWTSPSTALAAGDIAYEVTFTPKNTNWYTTATCMVAPHVLRATQTIDWSFDATEIYGNANYTFDAAASSGLTVTYSSSNNEVASVNDQNKLVLHKAGESVTITATQAGNETYLPVSESRTFTVLYWTPEIVENPVGGTMYVGHVLSDASLTGGVAIVNGDTIQGSFVWEDANTATINQPGPATHNAIFVPQNANFFAEVVCENIPLEVLRYLPRIQTNTLSADGIEFPATLESSNLHGSVTMMDYDRIPNVEVTGHVEWKTPTTILRPGTQNGIALFVPDNSAWYEAVEIPVSVKVTGGYVFNGDNNDSTWTQQANWAGNLIPGAEDPVLVNDYVEIKTSVTVGSLTIAENVDLVVKDGGVLRIGNDDSESRDRYGNLRVENGGQVIFGEGEVKVNDFVLEAKLGDNTEANPASSGQVDGAEQLTVRGDAYFSISFDPRGQIDYGWYDFTVPFEVDVMNGVYDEHGNKLTYNVDYAVMDFSESQRAVNGKHWNWFTGTLKPNRLYSITLEETKTWNTFLFKRKTNVDTYGSNVYGASCTDGAAKKDRGWNGMGNGTLQYRQLNNLPAQTKIQVYDHVNDRYTERDADEYTYAVGTAFFVQVDEPKNIDLTTVEDDRDFLAPARIKGRTFDEFRLALREEGSQNVADHLWVSASEDATGEYVIGRDLLKMGTPTNAKVAQMWCTNNGMILCDIEMPLVNNNASTPISIYAPKNGVYTLAVERAPEDVTLFLTKDGCVIWNLSQSGYLLDLTKGTTNEYGLCLVYSAPQVATGMDEVVHGVKGQKVIINHHIYIITSAGDIYDATGKRVN